ncbi:MAG: primosomal protein N' [Deltaproteobacteria bacterium]|jgi:primosomal protein N' (replication factor Y)|nr:primosomal protein N' [Deltaproteobacteria bacterium]
MYYSVAILSPPYSSLCYTGPDYLPEETWRPGLRVAVPLGKGLRAGIVLEKTPVPQDLPPGVGVKALCWPLEARPLFDAGYMDMIRRLALRQGVTPGRILGHALPGGLRDATVRVRHFCNGKVRLFSLRALAALAPEDLAPLGLAWVRGEMEILRVRSDAALGEYCRLATDPPWQVRPSASRQIALLDHLLAHGGASRRALLKALGQGGASALESLVRQKFVHIGPLEDEAEAVESEEKLLPPPPLPFELSAEQKNALATLREALNSPEPGSHLLFGVTGSGKTAIYLELVRECLAQGKSALLLAPEVALALKLMRDARLALSGAPLTLFHGYQSPARREKAFRELGTGASPQIVIGTRSALFLPIPDMRLIVLDEEHDASFKQEEGFSYHAKEPAWLRTERNKGLLVLGSATPDIKSYYAAGRGGLRLSRLEKRVGGAGLPHIRLVDIHGLGATDSLLAKESLAALRQTMERGEQAVVLLNRRGYAPQMYCLNCNETPRCPHCAISLCFHKGRERLLCHYCGYNVPFPRPCDTCKGLHYLPMGEGAERMAEHLSTLLAPAKVLRLDRDSTRRPGRMEEILTDFANQKAQILVGTQMLSKGHHFPEVTLALVADGDLGLNLPDYRAAERSFQLLTQSAGRAGRGGQAGEVLIQTRDGSHYCWDFIQRGDYEGFYQTEIAKREQRSYPPFVRLALARMSFDAKREDALAEIGRLGNNLRAAGREMDVVVLGPAPAPISMIRGRKRFHCLLKAQDWRAIRATFAKAAGAVEGNALRLALDLDPVNML